MKNSINFTEYLSNCLKRQQSLKSTTHLKMGLTVNAFHANSKPTKTHCRTKTDQFCPPETMSTTAVFQEGKLKLYSYQKGQKKKTNSEVQLKKANSHKILDSNNNQMKSCSTYKSNASKDSRQQTKTVRSLQKLRKDLLNKTNPEVVSQQLKQITKNDMKNIGPGTIANEYYLLSNQLLQKIKQVQRKHAQQMATQRQGYQRREQKIIRKMKQMEEKNQKCSTLINELRVRNIDIDGIWQQEKLNSKTCFLIDKK